MKSLCVAVLILGASAASASAGEPTPSGAAMTFYLLANQGRCVEAERLFTVESVDLLRKTLGARDGFVQFCRDKGGESPLEALAVKSEKALGDSVEVEITRTYKNGLAYERDTLVRQGPDWKIVIGRNVVANNLRK
jgi:hypothetical protein